ncbi:MAG: hypothetical protein RLZZ628_1968 [Bacteroidota bacterium]|jgi:hypothetical protein
MINFIIKGLSINYEIYKQRLFLTQLLIVQIHHLSFIIPHSIKRKFHT